MAELNKEKRIQAVGKFAGKNTEKQPVYLVHCQGCGKEIRSDEDLSGIEHVKTRGGRELFFHTECAKKVWDRKIL